MMRRGPHSSLLCHICELRVPFAINVAQQVLCASCRDVHATYGSQGDPNPTINLGLIFFVVVAGMGVVLGIPYMLYGKQGGQAKSWAQQLEDSRKVRVGHVS